MTFTFKHGDRPLEGYTIQRGVGRGGFGEVYYALSDSGKEVALKYLRDNPQIELRGVSQCMNLKSPYLVTVYDVRQNEANEPFIIMEYVSGPSLRDLLIAEGERGLGPQKAAFFLREIGKGLGYLHDRGIVHRDLKPGNIFYEDGYVKIGDYGLSKFISVSRHSAQTASVGTVHYMAPEVGTGYYHRGIDIYALGVILYEMLLGRVPYDGSSMGEVLMKHLTAQPALDELPAPFGEVIRRALAKDPKDRYQTVDEMTSAVFGVEDIRNSVARFEPTSISMAAARVVPAHVAVGVGGSSGVIPAPPVIAPPGTGGSGTDAFGRSGAAAPPGSQPGAAGQPRPGTRYVQRGMDPAEGSVGALRGQGADTAVRRGINTLETQLRHLEGRRPGDMPTFPPRSRWVAGLLGLFLGAFGAHRFYLGYTRVGIIQLVLTAFTGFAGLWGMIEGVLILCGEWGWMCDVYGRPLTTRQHRTPFLQERWIERLILAVIVTCALCGGTAALFIAGDPPGFLRGSDGFAMAFATAIFFAVAMIVAAQLGTLAVARLHTPPAPAFLGRLVVFGLGLLTLWLAAACCKETISPPYSMAMDSSGRVTFVSHGEGALRQMYDRILMTLFGSLSATMLLVNWVLRVCRGRDGRVELGAAVRAAIVAGVACIVFSMNHSDSPQHALLAAGIAAAASLAVQTASIFRPGAPGGDGGAAGRMGHGHRSPAQQPPEQGRQHSPYAVPLPESVDPAPGKNTAETAVAHGHASPAAGHPAQWDARHGPPSGALAAYPASDRRKPGGLAATLMITAITGGVAAIAFSIVLDASRDRALVSGALAVMIGCGSIGAMLHWRRRALDPIRADDRRAFQRPQPASASAGGETRTTPDTPPLERSGTHTQPPVLRSDAARICWGLLAAALLSAAVMSFVVFGTVRLGSHEQAVAVGLALACLGFEVLPLSKLTRQRRHGLYAETLRPFFIAVCLAAAGGAIGPLSQLNLSDDETVIAVGFLVVPLVFALFLTLVRGAEAAVPAPGGAQIRRASRSPWRVALGVVSAVCAALLLLGLFRLRPAAVYSGGMHHARYESTWDLSHHASLEKAVEACAERIASFLQERRLVDWAPARPFRLVVSARTALDENVRELWRSALLASLQARYPHAAAENVTVDWEPRQTAAGAEWQGEGVGENEVVLDLMEEQGSAATQTGIAGRLLAKRNGALHVLVCRCSYDRPPQGLAR